MQKINLSDNRLLRITTLCGLYVAQGIPFGFVIYTLTAYMAEKGLVENDIGNIVAWSTLPWAFKWIWGPIVDRFGIPSMGRRRPWIILAQIMMILTIGAMLLISDLDSNLKLICAMVFIHNIFNALQDVSVDALAVDILHEDERGKVNGYMYGAKYLGTMIGSSGLMLVIKHSNMAMALIVQIILLTAIMLLPLLLRERAGEKLMPWSKGKASPASSAQAFGSTLQMFKTLLKAFSLRSTILTAFLALFINFGIGILSVAGTVLMVQNLGWQKDQWVNLTGFWGSLIAVAGSILGGIIADKIGQRKTLAITGIIIGIIWITLSATTAHWPNKNYMIIVTLLETFLIAVMAVSFFSLAMGVSWPKVAATQFTAYMAIMNFSTTIGAKFAGIVKTIMLDYFPYTPNPDQVIKPGELGYDPNQVSNPFGIPDALMIYAGLYFCVGIFQLLMLLVLPFIDPDQSRRLLDGKQSL
ncbi:MAG: MFS transporter [Phycisphaerae bacterium]|nr:MFS transporter [Phycisphaerae bacterium]